MPRFSTAVLIGLVAAVLAAAGPAVPAVAAGPPQNPFLAPNPFSNIHNDTWMSDAYSIAGPTAGARAGYGPYSLSVCGSLAFDRRHRIVSVCPSEIAAPQARIFDPNTLKVLATYNLPDAPNPPGTVGYQNFTGGGYFFLDRRDRAWVATKTSHLFVLAVTGSGFRKVGDYNLRHVLRSSQRVTSALPDFKGNIWFVSKRGGVVGVLNPRTHRIRTTHADSEIENSFAVGRDGIYIVSERSMYRFDLGRGGRPVVVWKSTYRNSHIHKPGQVDAGSGTTPTIMSGGFVSITDNADPMDVVVYRTTARLRRGVRRVVCRVPVFHKGAGDTENSLIGSGRAMIVENNYGYHGFTGPDANALTSPGFARVDINASGRGCRRVWQTYTASAPTVVPKLSTRTGLIYTYTREPGLTAQWGWTALSFKTGRVAFKVPSGSGTTYNNNYAGIALGPTGAAYLGTIGGLTALRNGAPAVTSAAALGGGPAVAASVTAREATSLGTRAYRYGFPLLEFLRVRRTETSVRCPDGAGNAPVNTFSNAPRFARPRDRAVVAPNVDTLYSIAHLDLGRGPVVLSHPDMGRRYFVFELVDPYTNVIGYIGTRTTGTAARRFAITWSGHPGRPVAGATVIRSAYRRLWVIGRTLAGRRADQLRALKLMRSYRLAPPGGARTFARHCRSGTSVKAVTPTGLAFLDALGTAMAQNPPPHRDRPLLRELARVGVGPGRRPERAGLSSAALAALVSGVDQTATALPGQARLAVLKSAKSGHGWFVPKSIIGDYGTSYFFRAETASIGLGANTPREAVYPTALTDAAGNLLSGATTYRIVFRRGQLPPARAFWSVTLYDSSGFLVDNPAHRYAVGSSHPPLIRRADGSIVVVVSRTRPSEARVNWLPSPAGAFRLNMRLYWPRASVLQGRWTPPPVQPTGPAATALTR